MKKGFTLIELSIVLVIIGLIVGGGLVGKDLIEVANLRKEYSTSTKFDTAVNTFRLKYNGLPGDLKNATTFWGQKPACLTGSARSIDSTTCNGNDDQQVRSVLSTIAETEQYCFWQHLSNAGLISGNYSCTFRPSNALPEPGVEAPKNAIRNGYWYIENGYYWAMGTDSNQNYVDVALHTPLQIHQIDTKYDDGLPMTGTINTGNSGPGNCRTTNDPTTSQYLLSYNDPSCILRIKAGW